MPKAAERFFRKLLKGSRCMPRVLGTDKLGSYGAAKRELMEHRQNRYVDNRAPTPDERDRRSGSNPSGNRNVSYPLTAAFVISFNSAAIAFLQPNTSY